ncbi:hypothetical protein LTR49_028729 [Elasticomyces elasticus]|nr:hypothetical protein LTR49_028729 [Elasticomyces elasticus]
MIRLLLSSVEWIINLIDPKSMQLFHVKATVMSSGSIKKDLKFAHRTVFDELLDNLSLPAAEKALPWLVEEAQIVVSAGSTTTLYYLKCTTYFFLTDQAIHSAYVELLAAVPDPGTLTALPVLESLPFLAAVTKEGFWNNDAASSRLARVSPDDDLECGDASYV